MNLELLDLLGRQVPDRVDATIQLADLLHRPASQREQSDVLQRKDSDMDDTNHGKAETIILSHNDDDDASEYRAANHVAYNRRGTYLAVGHSSGTVAIHETQTRTLVALYHGDNSSTGSADSKLPKTNKNGCSSLSWSRRSRALLTGSNGDVTVRLYDTTHPLGPEEASTGLLYVSGTAAAVEEEADGEGVVAASPSPASHTSSSQRAALYNAAAAHTSFVTDEVLPVHSVVQTQHTPYADADQRTVHLTDGRIIATHAVTLGSKVLVGTRRRKDQNGVVIVEPPDTSSPIKKYPSVAFDFPHAVAGSLQINPCRPNAGLAVLVDGTLVLFWIPPDAFVQKKAPVSDSMSTPSISIVEPRCIIVPLTYDPSSSSETVAGANLSSSEATPTSSRNFECATFDPRGTKVYAVHKSGVVLGYNVAPIWKALSDAAHKSKRLPMCEPKFTWSLSENGGDSNTTVAVWHLMVSRNGKFLLLNSSNGSIRLYTTPKECWQGGDQCNNKTPAFVFQDVVNQAKFASCDLSGDGEYVVGGANGNNNKYELYIWNTSTGALMDKLTGASTKLSSVSWHPARSFLAVACADGLVDVWGPRINWTAFAPDFKPLTSNVKYIEREDEVDKMQVTPDSKVRTTDEKQMDQVGFDNVTVDVTTIKPAPVFASDSENEDDVFVFETRVKNLLAGRAERASRKSGVGVDD